MRQLFPDPEQIDDPLGLLAHDQRQGPDGRPWVMANMVASLDGAYAVEDRSGPLSGPDDREWFHALRGLTDVVLVAAGTARTERYRRPRAEPMAQALRRKRGQGPAPRLVLVSRSLAIPADQPFLEGPGPEPLVFHPSTVDPSGLPSGLEPRATGQDSVDISAALRSLASDGVGLVLCEGGPGLLGQLHATDLIDELFLTVSPNLVGGDRVGLLGSAVARPRAYSLHRAVLADDSLLLTYRRTNVVGPT